MSDMNTDYSIIDEIYLENEDKLRECKLAQVMLQVEIKNSETMLQQEEEKKDPNRGIFHTVDEHVFNSGLNIVVIARPNAKDVSYKEAESAFLHLSKLHGIMNPEGENLEN